MWISLTFSDHNWVMTVESWQANRRFENLGFDHCREFFMCVLMVCLYSFVDAFYGRISKPSLDHGQIMVGESKPVNDVWRTQTCTQQRNWLTERVICSLNAGWTSSDKQCFFLSCSVIYTEWRCFGEFGYFAGCESYWLASRLNLLGLIKLE